ncbi:hypothetical protein FRB90_002914 [Tulasnella sp. 427]|nr:hypothetical protein FRB90_002914 [Tulasnella sp. 427]
MGVNSLPPELWLEVFAASRQWRKASKWTIYPQYATFIAVISTCSRFHDIALPLLYEHALLRLDFGLGTNNLAQLGVIEILAAKPQRLQWVKTLTGCFTSPADPQENPDNYTMRSMFSRCIERLVPRLPALQVIHLDRPLITGSLMTSILNHQSLRILSVHDVKEGSGYVDPDEILRDGAKPSLVELRATSSSPFVTMQALYFLLIPDLSEITFTDYSLSQWRMSIYFAVRGLAQLAWQNLRVLKITAMMEISLMTALSDLCQVLAYAPNVETLIYDGVLLSRQGFSWRDHSPSPSTVLPKLKELYGPAVMAPLCEGKTVEKLGLVFHAQMVNSSDEENVSTLDCVADTLRQLIVGNLETTTAPGIIKMFPLLESLEILPSAPRCQRDTIPSDSKHIGQPRQDERSQLERWAEDNLIQMISTTPHLTRLVVRPFEGPGAIVVRRGMMDGEYRSRPGPPDPGPAPPSGDPCIDEKNLLDRLTVPCPDLKEVVLPSLHKWTRYHPTYGWELVERRRGLVDAEEYPLPFSKEELKPRWLM